MKKYMSIILCLLCVFLPITACNSPSSDDELSKNQEVEPTNSAKYALYYADFGASDYSTNFDRPLGNAEIRKPIEDADFYNFTKKYIETNDALQIRTVIVDGITYNVEYIDKSYQPKVSSKNFTDLSVITDKYESQNADSASRDGAKISVDRKTGRIVDFALLNFVEKEKEVGYLTVEQIQEKADQIANSLYGEEVMSQYTMFKELVNNGMNDDGTGSVAVLYKRKVLGYYTDDTIMLTFNRKGELILISNNEMMEMYKNVEEKLTKEEIETAEKYLVDTMTEKGYLIGSRTLRTSADGEYYLDAVVEVPVEGSEYPFLTTVYINIQ